MEHTDECGEQIANYGACSHAPAYPATEIVSPAYVAVSIGRGLDDSAAGRVHDLGDFTQYAEPQFGLLDDLPPSVRMRMANRKPGESTHCRCAERRAQAAE